MSGRGRLIVIEGPDGVGKSTLTQALVARLRALGLPCHTYAFPGNEPGTLGYLVYRLHHEPAELGVSSLSPAPLQAMHIAAHVDAITRVFLPRLSAGEHIVIDRYWWSTLVYGLVSGISEGVLEGLIEAERQIWGDHAPLVVFLVDRPIPWRVEEDRPEWHRLAAEYRRLGRREQEAGRVEVVANNDAPDTVAAGMVEKVIALLDSSSARPGRPEPQLRLDLPHDVGPADRRQRSFSMGRIGGLEPTAVFDTYWRFAVERQDIFFRRLEGGPPPWSNDPILQQHRFTNAYRASDRVSQYVIRHVIYEGSQQPEEIFFRTILFKLFNRIETWELLTGALGTLSSAEFKPARYDRVLFRAMQAGQRIYSAAYIMPAAPGGAGHPKHHGHLLLLERMLRDELPRKLSEARSLRQAFELLRAYPMMGDFLAFQFVTDLNYGTFLNFSEMEFVVPGPGARSGIRKCFASLGGLGEADLIRFVTESQQEEFARRGLSFRDLWGRPLQLIDCQNLFCEVDKYARVAHPEVRGEGGRTRIKQALRPLGRPPIPWYPPKWGLNKFIAKSEVSAHAPDRG